MAELQLNHAKALQQADTQIRDELNQKLQRNFKYRHNNNATSPTLPCESRLHVPSDTLGSELSDRIFAVTFPIDQLTAPSVIPTSISYALPRIISQEHELSQLVDAIRHVRCFAFSAAFQYTKRSYLGITCGLTLTLPNRFEGNITLYSYYVDTITLWDTMHNLSPVFFDAQIIKIAHNSADQLLALQRDFGIFVCNLFDTHIAAQEAALPSTDLPFLLHHYGISTHQPLAIETAHDWSTHPPTPEMLTSAIMSVQFLPLLYDLLRRDLRTTERILSVLNMSSSLCLERYQMPPVPIPIPGKCIATELDSAIQAAVAAALHAESTTTPLTVPRELCGPLDALYCWRDRVAREEDEGAEYVMDANTLCRIAMARPATVDALRSIAIALSPVAKRRQDEIISTIAPFREVSALSSDQFQRLPQSSNGLVSPAAAQPVVQPPFPHTASNRPTRYNSPLEYHIDHAKTILQQCLQYFGMPKAVFNVRSLEALAGRGMKIYEATASAYIPRPGARGPPEGPTAIGPDFVKGNGRGMTPTVAENVAAAVLCQELIKRGQLFVHRLAPHMEDRSGAVPALTDGGSQSAASPSAFAPPRSPIRNTNAIDASPTVVANTPSVTVSEQSMSLYRVVWSPARLRHSATSSSPSPIHWADQRALGDIIIASYSPLSIRNLQIQTNSYPLHVQLEELGVYHLPNDVLLLVYDYWKTWLGPMCSRKPLQEGVAEDQVFAVTTPLAGPAESNTVTANALPIDVAWLRDCLASESALCIMQRHLTTTGTTFDQLRTEQTERTERVRAQICAEFVDRVFHTEFNQRTYIASGVDFAMTPQATLVDRDGNRITFEQYFREVRHIEITEKSQPMIEIKMAPERASTWFDVEPHRNLSTSDQSLHTSEGSITGEAHTIWLVPETCQATGFTREMVYFGKLVRVICTQLATIAKWSREVAVPLENRLDIHFNNRALLRQALTHPAMEASAGNPHYQRLEFLGDAVLDAIVSAYVFRKHPRIGEAALSNIQRQIVQNKRLSEISRQCEIDRAALLPPSMVARAKPSGHSNDIATAQSGDEVPAIDRVPADLLEALIGAIYLDLGLDVACRFVHRWVVCEGKAPSHDTWGSHEMFSQQYDESDVDAAALPPALLSQFEHTAARLGLNFTNILLFVKAFTRPGYVRVHLLKLVEKTIEQDRTTDDVSMLTEVDSICEDNNSASTGGTLSEDRQKSFERLEFLGNSIIKYLATEYVFHAYPNDPEGLLHEHRTKIISNEVLAGRSKALELHKIILYAGGVGVNAAKEAPKVLADAFSALAGAILLDQGIDACRRFIDDRLIKPLAEEGAIAT